MFCSFFLFHLFDSLNRKPFFSFFFFFKEFRSCRIEKTYLTSKDIWGCGCSWFRIAFGFICTSFSVQRSSKLFTKTLASVTVTKCIFMVSCK